MKEEKIVIEIDPEGNISADAQGFSGDACITDLEKLLDRLSPGISDLERKPEAGKGALKRQKTQTVGRKR